ncbi:unnamed protein product [Hymenolepis diminuta]|uniref:Uncharacterized protein n=1 Tax=Hymenolepis diminuta TaxID=6216 RepID=A0A564YKI7_HYMDI|nr:unnamed protein product [Hymenolepis diminuta]
MLWRGLTQVTHIKLPLFVQTTHTGQCGLLRFPFISSLPQHAALSLPLSLLLIVASLNVFLVYSTLGVLLHNCC